MYEYGRGVPKDYGEALRWYRKAAEKGMAPAQDRIPVEAVRAVWAYAEKKPLLANESIGKIGT
jgi:TPR repeat protein